jgi:hypothetical protein
MTGQVGCFAPFSCRMRVFFRPAGAFFDFLAAFWYIYPMKPVLYTVTVEGIPA